MAEAPGHRLGQIIGDALELSVEPLLRDFARRHDLYLDRKEPRPTRRGVKVTWTDSLGNSHDLDFVLERGGTRAKVGNPAAFIEVAWRRYTKHSKAKAQEIQGAILPLLTTHASVKPFSGAVVAGEWTRTALQQMRSSGIEVVHIPYSEVVDVFRSVFIDVDSDESTPDALLQEQVDKWERLSGQDHEYVGELLRRCSPAGFYQFQDALEHSVSRSVEQVIVMPLHGTPVEHATVSEAIAFVRSYRKPDGPLPLSRFIIIIRYSNSDRIEAEFGSGVDAEEFLQTFV